jgi:hypothetical protein
MVLASQRRCASRAALIAYPKRQPETFAKYLRQPAERSGVAKLKIRNTVIPA